MSRLRWVVAIRNLCNGCVLVHGLAWVILQVFIQSINVSHPETVATVTSCGSPSTERSPCLSLWDACTSFRVSTISASSPTKRDDHVSSRP